MTETGRERIVGDWGTSRLRLFRLRDNEIVDRLEGPGIGVAGSDPGDVLDTILAPWREDAARIGLTVCGMVGSRNGLVEVGYVDAPADAARWAEAAHRTDRQGVSITIAAGLACRRQNLAADVMRGEETQLFGAMTIDPSLARGRHLAALPGTHGKWVRVEDGRVTEFRTYFTGELFALLREHSTLLRAGHDPAGEAEGFVAGLERIAGDPDLLGCLFEARAAQLCDGRAAGWAAGFLSGLLIGSEVSQGAGGSAAVVLIGAPTLTARYAEALRRFGADPVEMNGDACAIAGLVRLSALAEGSAR